MKQWIFSDAYYDEKNPTVGGDKMTADGNNPGWYYKDLGVKATPKITIYVDDDKEKVKYPEPGTTLLIFYNNEYRSEGCNLHRVTHHREAGIPLFNFEDREGWIVYDPTTSPYYKIFDDKPIIEDVVYTIYSDGEPSGWFQTYGVANGGQFTIYNNNTGSVTNTSGVYEYKIRMKAPRGEYAKAIKIKFANSKYWGDSSKQRVYYSSKKNNDNNSLYGGSGGYPRVYLYNSDKDNIGWNNAITMNYIGSKDDTYYFYLDIPEKYKNGYVIFRNAVGDKQMPTSGGYSLGGKTKMYKSYDGNSWNDFNPPIEADMGVMLFNGRVFPNNTGTFKNGKWEPGKTL